MKKTVVYQQILEAIRWYARENGIYVSEILEEIYNDVLHGTYEKFDLASDLEFWREAK